MKSYPEYVVEDEKKIRFIKRVTKRNSDLTTNDASNSSKYSVWTKATLEIDKNEWSSTVISKMITSGLVY